MKRETHEKLKGNFLIIFIASAVALTSNLVYNLYDGSSFSIIQILTTSLAAVVAAFIGTAIVWGIIYFLGVVFD